MDLFKRQKHLEAATQKVKVAMKEWGEACGPGVMAVAARIRLDGDKRFSVRAVESRANTGEKKI